MNIDHIEGVDVILGSDVLYSSVRITFLHFLLVYCDGYCGIG